MNNTALILNIGTVTDQNRAIKTLAGTTWAKLGFIQVLVPFFEEKGVSELSEQFGFQLVPCTNNIKINEKPYPLFSTIFEECSKHLLPSIEQVIYSNGDIVPISDSKTFISTIESCEKVSKGDYIGLIHRYNFGKTTPPTFDSLKQLIDNQPINYPGVDSFVCSRVVFERLVWTLPPLIMVVYGPDRWLLDWSFHCVDMTFFLEQNIKTAHITHPQRKESIQQSKDFLTTKNPLITHNRQYINLSLKEIFKDMTLRDLQLTNGLTLREVFRQW